MVIIDGRRWIWRDRLVFFPNVRECQNLIEGLEKNALIRMRQVSFPLRGGSHLVQAKPFSTSCIDLNKSGAALFDEMDSQTKRYVRKAEKLRDRWRIRINDYRAHDDFFELYNRFVGLKGHAHRLSRRRFQEYLKVSDVWMMYIDGRPIAGRLVVRDDAVRRVRMVLSPTSRLISDEDARLSGTLNRYLHWQEIVTYKQQGMELYDFGGIGDGSSSIAKFKLSFGGFRVNDHSYVYAGSLARMAYRLYQRLSNASADLRILRRQLNSLFAPPQSRDK